MTDAIVVGGGPAGAATALRLARRGARVTLLERARYPRHKACAEYMSPGVVRQLRALGVGAVVERAAGARLDGFTVYARGVSFTGRFASASAGTAPRHGLGISRAVLDEILAHTAAEAGVEVCEDVRVMDLLRDDDQIAGVRMISNGRIVELHAPLVIGADGIHSVVANRLRALEQRRGMERIALVAHVGGIEELESRGEMHVGGNGYCGVAPLGGGVANVAMVLRGAAERIRGRPEAFFWEELRSLPDLRGRIGRATIVRPVIAVSGMSLAAQFLSTDGAMLVGDAGGFYDPFTGQGVHRALVSAAIAARVAASALATGDHSADSLAEYDRQRRARLRLGHAVEWLIQRFITRPRLFDRAARRLARDQSMADTLVGVTGDIVSPRAVLNPLFLARLGV